MIVQGKIEIVEKATLHDLERAFGKGVLEDMKFWINVSYLKNLNFVSISGNEYLAWSGTPLQAGCTIHAKIDERFSNFHKNGTPLFLDFEDVIVEEPPYSFEQLEKAREGYYIDPYITAFKAGIIEKDRNKIILDRTFFYPGGGGQEHDTGYIGNYKVKKVYKNRNNIIHEINSSSPLLNVGDHILCKIDWKRRYNLMKAHTAEHLFMRFLMQANPDCELIKINLTENLNIVYMKGNITWDMLRTVQARVNETIQEERPVLIESIFADDAHHMADLRIKWNQLKATDIIRIVEIEHADWAACTGLHVSNTKEIGYFVFKKLKASRRGANNEIYFSVGHDGCLSALESNTYLGEINYMLNTENDRVVQTITNMLNNNRYFHTQVKTLTTEILDGIKPIEMSGYTVYRVEHSSLSDTTLKKWINKVIENPRTIVLAIVGKDSATVYLCCSQDVDMNCGKALSNLLEKAGGSSQFAVGKTTTPAHVADEIKKIITSKATTKKEG